jgi:hypothetical protein
MSNGWDCNGVTICYNGVIMGLNGTMIIFLGFGITENKDSDGMVSEL